MSSKNPRTTAYSEFVFTNVVAQLTGRAGLYNINELAQMVGLKPTGNFRKRVKQLVKEGKIDVHAVFTSRNGIEARYCINVEEFTLEG